MEALFQKISKFDYSKIVEAISLYGMQLLGAVAIFVVGRFFASRIAKLAKKLMQKGKLDKMLVSFSGNIIYFLILGFVVIAALSQIGVETTSIAAAIAAAGLAVALALQGSLSNFAAGFLIVVFRPFKAGDYIEVSGAAGEVDEISIFTTTLKTVDNKTIIVPNSQVTNCNIINYSSEPTRRVDMLFSTGYDDDVAAVKKLLAQIVAADERVLKKPEPQIALAELGASSVNYVVRPWVKNKDYWDVKFAITEAVKLAFDKAGFVIPYPKQDLYLHNVSDEKPVKKKAKK